MDVIVKTSGSTHDARLSLRQALLDFRTVLTPEEQADLDRSLATTSAPTAASVLELTQEIDNNNAGRRTRKIGARLQPFLDGIQQFTAIVDAFIGFGPAIAETVWGIIKISLLLASNASSYFEKLSELLKSIGDSCPRFQDFALLYQGSRRLQNALCAYFEQVIRLARQAVKISRTPAAIRLVRTALWPFDIDFGPIQASLNEAANHVSEEVDLASAKLQIEDAELSKLERKEATDGRKLLAAFSSSTRTEIAELKNRWQAHDIRQKRRTILQIMARLCAFDCITAWRRIYKQAVAGTAEWFATDPVYQHWVASPTAQTLLVVGGLGSGKSVLIANMVAKLRTKATDSLKLAYFFCPNSPDPLITPDALCCSLIGQLIEADLEAMPLEMLDQLEAWSSSKSWRRVLDKYATFMDPTMSYCIVVDNLEYLNSDVATQVLEMVQEIYDTISPTATVRVLLGLRQGTDTAAAGKFPDTSYLRLRRARIDADVRLFVEAALAEKYDMGQLQLFNFSLISQICEYIVEGAQGMFLWARLVLDQICYLASDDSIVEALRRLPTKLLDMFELLLDQTCRDSKYGFLPNLFMWVLGSKRPLTLEELAQALSLERGQSRLGPSRGRQDVVMAIAATRGLLSLDTDDLTVSPVHHSFRQYLLRERVTSAESPLVISLPALDAELGCLTMTYLTFEDFASKLVKSGQSRELAEATRRILPATHKALEVESKTAQSIVRIRRALYRSPSPGSHSTVTQDIEARLGELWLQLLEETKKQKQDVSQFPLLHYAKSYWYTHASSLDPDQDEASWRLFLRLFSNKEGRYDQPWYNDVPLEPERFVEWYTEIGNPKPLSDWSDEEQKVMAWACTNHHFAAIEAQLIILHHPPREIRWSNPDRGAALERLERTLLSEALSCQQTAAIACRHPTFFGAVPDPDTGSGKEYRLDSFVAILAVRFNLPQYLGKPGDPDGRLTQKQEWSRSGLNQVKFLYVPKGRWPWLSRKSGEDPAEPDDLPSETIVSPFEDYPRIQEDIRTRLNRPFSLSQMAILYCSNEAYQELQRRGTDPTPMVDLVLTALHWQNWDIADSLASSLQQPLVPMFDIPTSLILFALRVNRSDIAVTLCKIKFSVILQEEGGPSRWARLLHRAKTLFFDEGSTPEEYMLVEGLRCAFEQRAVDLFAELVRCLVRPARLPPDHSVLKQMRQQAKIHPGDLDLWIMVNFYEDVLKKTPPRLDRTDRVQFPLLIALAEIVLLPLLVLLWFLMLMRDEHIFSQIFTMLIAGGSIWAFISMVAGPNPLFDPVRGAYKLIRFFVEL